jgi:protocatechuate 3,4-dioxygenase beta subunit
VIPIICALLLQATPQRDTTPLPAAAATGSIAGRVVSADAQPRALRRARVTIGGGSLPYPRTTISGDDGAFVFERVPAGRFTVSAAKDGYAPMNYGATRSGRPGTTVAVADGQPTRVELRLPRGAVIAGTVTDVDGQPAAGIRVNVMARQFSGTGRTDYRYATLGTPGTATTDDRGAYRVFGLPAGEYIVAAQPAPALELPAGTDGIAVRMMTRGATNSKDMLLSQVFHPTGTDPTRAGHVSVRAGEERTGIDVQLEYVPLATITGMANLPVGFGPARITLTRLDELARLTAGPVTSADAQGRFTFRSVPPGRYRLAARGVPPAEVSNSRISTAVNVQYAFADVVVTGEDVDVALATQAALTIAGRVAFDTDGAPPAELPTGLRVNLQVLPGPGGSWGFPQLVIDGARFRMDGIVPGTYRALNTLQGIRAPIGRWWLTSVVAGGRDLLDSPLEFRESIDDAVATLSDRVSDVTGTVSDPQGRTQTDAYVVVFSVDRGTWFPNSRRVVAVRPDREGRYSIRNLPPGEYRAAVAADLDQGEWFDPTVLDALLPAAQRFTVAGAEKVTVNLISSARLLF